ncbi:MAG: acyl-CoA dehydrogenase family protein [Acidimicrobiia bacterium]
MTVLEELHRWLDANWNPSMPLRDWWRLLADAGWSRPAWPSAWYGRDASPAEAAAIDDAIWDHGAVITPSGFGTNMAGPTLLIYGTDDQRRRHLPGIIYGTDAYCQLFSEPNAGSDLAGLQTKAVRDGDDWVINGQKVWTSRGSIATKAILLARTNADVVKQAGISFFILDMATPGVEVRPLKEMTGRSYFNEVFLTDVRIPATDLIGGEGNGWKVANTTLGFERSLSSGEHRESPEPGEKAGNLDRPAGPRVVHDAAHHDPSAPTEFETLLTLAHRLGRTTDPTIRQTLARFYTLDRLNQLTSARGADVAGLANLAKMAQNHAVRLGRELTFSVLGANGLLFGYDDDAVAAANTTTGLSELCDVIEVALWSPAPSIYGGSDQIQRNIVGERVLGLPREPK